MNLIKKLVKKLLCRFGLICAGHIEHEKDGQGIWWIGLRCQMCGKLCHPIKSMHQDTKGTP